MTDNQDSKIKSGVQTPPTDRPLTAGDVPLLREGDVLRVVEAGSFLLGRGLVDGGPAIVRSVEPPYVDVYGPKERSHNRPSRFTFVSRPATSAASEGEGVNASTLAAAVSSLERSLYRHGHGEKWGCDYVAVRTVLAALASPPVSERERELEGALDKAVVRFRHCAEMIDTGFNILGTTRVQHAMKAIAYADEAARALTAQPAGEGK